jgi:hypothetical protein
LWSHSSRPTPSLRERIIARRKEVSQRRRSRPKRPVLPRRIATLRMSLSIAGLKVFVGAANRPPASRRRGFLWPLPRAAATRWRYRHGFRFDILPRVDRNRGAETRSPFLLEASLKVKLDCAHSHLLARIAPVNPELTQSFKGPPSLYTLSAFARLGCVRTRIRWRGGRARPFSWEELKRPPGNIRRRRSANNGKPLTRKARDGGRFLKHRVAHILQGFVIGGGARSFSARCGH